MKIDLSCDASVVDSFYKSVPDEFCKVLGVFGVIGYLIQLYYLVKQFVRRFLFLFDFCQSSSGHVLQVEFHLVENFNSSSKFLPCVVICFGRNR